MSNEVAEKKETALARVPEQSFNGGFGEASADDFAVPYIRVIQSGSPQVKKKDEKYIEGAEAGMFFNTVSLETFSDAIRVVPCFFAKSCLEFNLREKGGGLVAVHPADYPKRVRTQKDDSNRVLTQDGTQLVDCRSYYCLMLRDDADPEPVVISMTSTQLKKSRSWLFNLQKYNAEDISAGTWKITTIEERNAKGEWWGLVIGLEGATPEDIHADAVRFGQAVQSGMVQATGFDEADDAF